MKKTSWGEMSLPGRIFLGALMGIGICTLIAIFISIGKGDGYFHPTPPSLVDKMGNQLNATMLEMALSAVLGAAFAGTSIVWELEDWSLARQTGTYFGVTAPVMLVVAYFNDWMGHSLSGLLSFFVIYMIIFVMMWLITYLVTKRRIESINREIAGKK